MASCQGVAKGIIMKHASGRVVALMIAAIGMDVPAHAACWGAAEVSAAKVRDLETMLMVSALRCRAGDPSILPAYNNLVMQSRDALTAVNDQLRAHFSAGIGSTAGLNAYDRYVTAIANRYGGGARGLSCADMASILSAANAEGGSATGLARLASDAGVEPVLDDVECQESFAAR